MSNQIERNKALLGLCDRLIKNEDWDSLNMVGTIIKNDTPAMKKSYLIITTGFAEFIDWEQCNEIEASMKKQLKIG